MPARRTPITALTAFAALLALAAATGCRDCGLALPATDATPPLTDAATGDATPTDAVPADAASDAAPATDAAPCDLGACPFDDTITAPIDFATEIQTVFSNYCAFGGCHGSGMSAELYLAAGAACAEIVNVPAMESSLDRIEPGSLIDSYMFHKIRGTQWCPEAYGGGSRMPLAGPCLSPEIIGTFRAWILDGAPCN